MNNVFAGRRPFVASQPHLQPLGNVMRRHLAIFTLILAWSWCAAAAKAVDSDPRLSAPQLFPEKTLLYLRINDVRQLKADVERSSLGKLGQDEQLKPILMEFYGSLVRNTAEMQDTIGLNLDELLSIPSGEMAIALLAPDRGRDSSGST